MIELIKLSEDALCDFQIVFCLLENCIASCIITEATADFLIVFFCLFFLLSHILVVAALLEEKVVNF